MYFLCIRQGENQSPLAKIKMTKEIKNHGGLFSPLNCENANFEYEVDIVGEVKNVEYNCEGESCTQPERNVLLKKAGKFLDVNELFCTICGPDALKPLREGELISADLIYWVKKDELGNHQQQIIASNILTLNDYFKTREESTLWKAGLRDL